MLSYKEMPQSGTSLFAAYASFATTMMMIRSIATNLFPPRFISFISSILSSFFPSKSSLQITLVIEKKCDYLNNQIYEAAEIYLRTKIGPSMDRLKVYKTPRQNKLALSMEKGQEILDDFGNVRLQWRLVSTEKKDSERNSSKEEQQRYELLFEKKFLDRIIEFYLPYVLQRAKEIKELDSVARLCGSGGTYSDECGGDRSKWGSIRLQHPATFDTVAMDPDLKKMIIEDLDRFVKRKEFYRKVGKAWKRGYLLYGPPGTGKSSLIAAMANYLKFDVYDLDLSDMYNNRSLRSSLLSTTNRSILVIADLDCSVNMQNRKTDPQFDYSRSFTLSGILNFMDGLRSSCGDENHNFHDESRGPIGPALLRPGRMDVHINLTYCTSKAFKVLATNYLGGEATGHPLYGEIERLIDYAKVTPAEVAGELMKSYDIDMAPMEGLAKFVKLKKEEQSEESEEPEEEDEIVEEERRKIGEEENGAAVYLLEDSDDDMG